MFPLKNSPIGFLFPLLLVRREAKLGWGVYINGKHSPIKVRMSPVWNLFFYLLPTAETYLDWNSSLAIIKKTSDQTGQQNT